MYRTIETDKFIIEQFLLQSGHWAPLKRYNKKTGKQEL